MLPLEENGYYTGGKMALRLTWISELSYRPNHLPVPVALELPTVDFYDFLRLDTTSVESSCLRDAIWKHSIVPTLFFTPSFKVKIGANPHKHPHHHLKIGYLLPLGYGGKDSRTRLWSLEIRSKPRP